MNRSHKINVNRTQLVFAKKTLLYFPFKEGNKELFRLFKGKSSNVCLANTGRNPKKGTNTWLEKGYLSYGKRSFFL